MNLDGTFFSSIVPHVEFSIHFALKVISKNLFKNQVAQIYLHHYEFVSDMSFHIIWKEMNGLSFFLKLYWLLRQTQWHIVSNKSVMRKLEKYLPCINVVEKLTIFKLWK